MAGCARAACFAAAAGWRFRASAPCAAALAIGLLVVPQSFGKARFLQLYAGPARDYMTVYGVGERELVERFWEHVDRLDVQHDGAYYAFKAYLQGRD